MTAPGPTRPEVRLVGTGAEPQATHPVPPPRRPPVLVPAAVLLLVAVIVLSVRAQARDLDRVRRTTVHAAVGAVVLDEALHLDIELVNDGPPARVVDARLLVTGAQPLTDLHVAGTFDGTALPAGHSHLRADLAAQCGPEGPLAPFEGTVVIRLDAGGVPRELRVALPVERARGAAERDCRPVVLSAGLARDGAGAGLGAGTVRLTVRVRTRAAGRVRSVQSVAYAGRPVAVLGATLPFSAGVPGIDTVTSFAVLVPVGCAGTGPALVAVLDEETLDVPLDPDAQQALQGGPCG